MATDAPKPGSDDQAPEVSFRGHGDDGPILATQPTWNSTSSFTYNNSPQYQPQQDKSQTGYSPMQQQAFLPQYAQSMQHPVSIAPPAEQQQQQSPTEPPAPPTKTKRKWLWPLAVVIASLMALGTGIGIGYAVGDNTSSSSSNSDSTNNTSEFVTSGSTGITAFACNPSARYTSPKGTTFAQECGVSYKTNQTAYDNSSLIVKNFAGFTAYSFEQCMNECVNRNLQLNIGNMLGDKCEAVSFYANLTYSIPAWAANCFLKNAKGIGRNWDTNSNESLTASGYVVQYLTD